MTEFDQAYHFACATADWARERVQGLEIPNKPRQRLAGAAQGLALEHLRAMVAAVDAQAYGSSLALLRPALEAFALGYWLSYLASDEQLDAFMRGQMTLGLDLLLRHIADDNPAGPRRADLQTLVRRLHTFTHASLDHLVKRQALGSVGPRYTSDEMANALRMASWFAQMAAVDLVGGTAGNSDLASKMINETTELQNRYESLRPSSPD